MFQHCWMIAWTSGGALAKPARGGCSFPVDHPSKRCKATDQPIGGACTERCGEGMRQNFAQHAKPDGRVTSWMWRPLKGSSPDWDRSCHTMCPNE